MIMKNNRNSNKKKGAFLLRPVQVQNGRKNRLTAFLTDVCFVWLYLAGMTFWLESSLQLDLSMGICLLAALAAAGSRWMVREWCRKTMAWNSELVWCPGGDRPGGTSDVAQWYPSDLQSCS